MSTSDQTPTGPVRTSTSPRPPGASTASGQQGRVGGQGTGGQGTGGQGTGGSGGARTITPGSSPPATGGRPAAKKTAAKKAPPRPGTRPPGAPRRVRLTVARVDPWSVMKLAFLLSMAIGVAMVVAAAVLWTVLDGMGIFTQINDFFSQILGPGKFDVNDYVGFVKVVSLGTVIAVVNVVLLTALATLGAFLYNIATNLVGGLHLTLSDD